VDSEGMGGGLSTYDYGFRIYNPHIAKFLSTDALSKDYPWYTPYQFAGNKPIIAVDLDGLEEFIRTDYMNAAGNVYRTEIQVVKRTPVSGQIVHQCVVAVDNFGNAAINYVGTSYGNTLPGGMGSNLFNPLENALIWNSNLIIANTTITNQQQGPLVGSLWRFTAPDDSQGNIVTGQMLIPGAAGGPPLFNLLNGVVVGGTAGISNGDSDYNGILVLTGMGAVPPNEPYTPAGFNNVPNNPARRINSNTGLTFAQDIAAGITTNSGGQSLAVEASTPQGCVLSGNNDSTTSDVGAGNTAVINVPSRNAVSTGNAQNTVPSGTITISN
jgi:RHS repeat-associated protein